MHSSLPDLPVPAWLAHLTAESMQRDPLPLTEILQDSLYYPAAGFDGDPVKRLMGKFHSYIYVDYDHTSGQLTDALSHPEFRGYEILGRREVLEKELIPQGWNPQPPPASERRRPPSGWIKPPFCSWTVLQKREHDSTAPNKNRFSLLYLCADGVAAYQALYTSNQKFPACVAVIQPGTGFGGNWTGLHRSGKSPPPIHPRQSGRHPTIPPLRRKRCVTLLRKTLLARLQHPPQILRQSRLWTCGVVGR